MKKVYYIAGAWDLFHVGHLRAIQEARRMTVANTLIVGVCTDQNIYSYKLRYPIIPYEQRFEIIEALKYPDVVVRQDVQFDIEHMNELVVDTVLLGADWQKRMPPHLKAMMKHVTVQFLPRTPFVSTSYIKQKIIMERKNE